jgi:ADP-heptose:LPS heptosyltransferase
MKSGLAKTVMPRHRLLALVWRHVAALGYVVGVILPAIFKTGRRPVLFVRQFGLGDIICSIPAAWELMKRHPGATFIYNCSADFAAVPKLGGIADRVTSLPEIDLIGYWYRFLLGGFYSFANGDPLVVRTTIKDFCQQFGVPVHEDHPRLEADSASRARAEEILSARGLGLQSLILFHPGPTLPIKEWPRESWAKLVASLHERGFHNVAQLGVGKYALFGNVPVEPIPGAVSLVDALSVEEMVGAISLARLYIGIDSGPLHIAAALGIPLVGIFGATLPPHLFVDAAERAFVVSQVECRGCGHYNAATPYITDCPYHIRCMKTVSPEEVLASCLTHLGTPASS